MSYTLHGRKIRCSRKNMRRVPRNRRRPNYGLLTILFFAAVFASGAVSYALQTPSLIVRQVKITGVRLADAAKVELAAKPALGKNILLVNKAPITKRIAALPEVASVTMGRTFPDGVWVRVKERRPDAILIEGGRCCMVRMDGLAFHFTDGPVRGIPTVELPNCERIEEGRKLQSQAAKCALAALSCARRERLGVRKISVDPLGDMCLNMEDGFYVKLGQPDDIARKMSILRTALACRPSIGREAVYIDLSCPSAPVWKPKSAAGAAS